MTIPLDVDAFLNGPISEPYEKQPGQWRRKGVDGPPYVTDPNGALVKSGARKGLPKLLLYGRPSSRGKLIENTYNLQKWGERMAMWGALVLGPDDRADIGAIPAEIDTPEWRSAMDKIVVRAKDAAQAMIAAQRGTHGHLLTEDDDEGRSWANRMLAGEELGISQEAQKALVQAWRRMLAVHGLEILAVEAAVVCDRWCLAGTLDRIVRLTRDMAFVTSEGEVVTLPAGTILILDLKTGRMTIDRGVIKYWQGYAIQLAAYALGVPYDVDAETRGAWPFEVSTKWAIIAHLDVLGAIEEGEARCTLVLCDLEAGIAAGDLCMAAAEWGRNAAVFSPPDANPEMVVAVPVEATKQATDDDFARVNGEPSLTPTSSTAPSAPSPTTTPDDPSTSAPAAPAGGASPRTVQQDLDILRAPAREVPEPPDEGPDVDEEDVSALRKAFAGLDTTEQLWLSIVVNQSAKAGYPLNLGHGPTKRRWTIGTALVHLARLVVGADPAHDEELIRALIGVVMGKEIQPSVPTGAAVASLTIDEAERLATLAGAVGADAFVRFDDAGDLGVFGPAVDAARRVTNSHQ